MPSRLWHLKRLGSEDFDEVWDPYHECVGHNPDDLQPFHDLFPQWDVQNATLSDDHTPGIKSYYTNGELYDLLRPDENTLPYIYDNFNWPHCSVNVLSTIVSPLTPIVVVLVVFIFSESLDCSSCEGHRFNCIARFVFTARDHDLVSVLEVKPVAQSTITRSIASSDFLQCGVCSTSCDRRSLAKK